jgi:four helix bundle protein
MGLLPRYHAACEMESDRAFSRKISQCRRMLREARAWLSVIEKRRLLPHERIKGMQSDTIVMEAIFSRIIHEIERRLV